MNMFKKMAALAGLLVLSIMSLAEEAAVQVDQNLDPVLGGVLMIPTSAIPNEYKTLLMPEVGMGAVRSVRVDVLPNGKMIYASVLTPGGDFGEFVSALHAAGAVQFHDTVIDSWRGESIWNFHVWTASQSDDYIIDGHHRWSDYKWARMQTHAAEITSEGDIVWLDGGFTSEEFSSLNLIVATLTVAGNSVESVAEDLQKIVVLCRSLGESRGEYAHILARTINWSAAFGEGDGPWAFTTTTCSGQNWGYCRAATTEESEGQIGNDINAGWITNTCAIRMSRMLNYVSADGVQRGLPAEVWAWENCDENPSAESDMEPAQIALAQAEINLGKTASLGDEHADEGCKTCVFVIERIKKGTNMLLPSIVVDLKNESESSFDQHKDAETALAHDEATVAFDSGTIPYVNGTPSVSFSLAKEWVRPCPSHVMVASVAPDRSAVNYWLFEGCYKYELSAEGVMGMPRQRMPQVNDDAKETDATSGYSSWILPLAPVGYGGSGVINPYSNVNPLNLMSGDGTAILTKVRS
jgi:hypothetical protein